MVSSRIHPIGLHSGGGSSSSPLLKYEDVLKKFCKNRVSIPSKLYQIELRLSNNYEDLETILAMWKFKINMVVV
jgi:hypothetical protein